MRRRDDEFDVIVVGSGFGGTLAAWPLVCAGLRVLMLERGAWVSRGPDNWSDNGVGLITTHYTHETSYRVDADAGSYRAGSWHCVGGQSVFYGGASLRYRMADFEPAPEITGTSGAEWPFRYDAMEPYYAEAERLLHVAGEAGTDPCEPPRSCPFPHQPAPLSRSASRIADAAASLGLQPFRLPLAITYDAISSERNACVNCSTCDGYACPVQAKSDVATGIIPALVRRGLTLRPNTVVIRLVRDGTRITAVQCVDRTTGVLTEYRGTRVILAAGALATPHLLLVSDLARINPAGHAVGRYLTRHRNTVVLGMFSSPPNPERAFDKQIAIHDFYFGLSDAAPAGKLGGIQQLTPPAGLVRAYLPRLLSVPVGLLMSRCSGLLVLAEDQPQYENGVTIGARAADRFGLPQLHVRHHYTSRDEAAAAVLVREARRILRAAGARFTFTRPIETFSHAVGTVRMGSDENTAPLDADGRYRGLDNLYVTDGSAFPTSAAVNPSLTIAANALRIGSRIARATASRPASATSLLHRRALRVLPHHLVNTGV